MDDNRAITKVVVLTSLELVATDVASDVTYPVLCGTCPDAYGEHLAYYAVAYDSADLDGDAAPERLFTCKLGLGETYAWAEEHNQSFVPPSISKLRLASLSACPHCGAAYFACVTDARGLCVKGSVTV